MRRVLLLVALIGPLAGCGTLPDGRRWGEGATLSPGWMRVRTAAATATRDPGVWAPLAGAAVLSAGSLDEDLARWANEETPLFGSRRDADRASDKLRDVAELGYYATVLATPGGEAGGDWFAAKARGLAVGLAAGVATRATTGSLKAATARERPDGSDRESFPSGHTSGASAYASSAAYQLRFMALDDGTRGWLACGLHATTFATGWARLEAGKHHPTDVLVGAALGRWFALFMHEAFLGLDGDAPIAVLVAPEPGTVTLRLSVRF